MKLATLLYIRNEAGEYLLMKRRKDPNKGLMSPPGGKLKTESAESPDECAAREAFEECRLVSKKNDWLLRGIITEKNFPHAGNIMIFLMEYKNRLTKLPDPCNEGSFFFINPNDLFKQELPVTDREFIWKYIIESNDVFMISLDCTNYPAISLNI